MDPQHGPPPTDVLIGQTIGNYLVIQKLGEGGMGAVYLAEHPKIKKKVALKVLHAEFSSNEEITQRFFNEAKAVNDIGHPNIVDIIDYGVIQPAGREQLVYFIMEYLQGSSLAGLIRAQAPLPPERAFAIAIQIADALAASHKQGIVHRDLKPDNVMLQQRGRDADFVKLLDFGIAKLTNDSTGSSRTRAGIIMGTPAYMSPEQCEGRGSIDHRTDIYALGIVLYEMLTGRVPFIGEGYGEIIVQHLAHQPPPPSAFRMLPPHVEAVVMKALEKRPDMRYPTMEEMMRAMADPVGYVESHGGVQGFLQTQLMPSNTPVPMRTPFGQPGAFTPAPGTLTAPSGYGTPGSGIYPPGSAPTPTTLGAASGQVTPKKGKTGFLIAGLLVVGAAGAGIAVVLSGKKVEGGGGTTQTADAAVQPPPPTPGSNDKTVDRGSAGSATTPSTGSAGSGGSADTPQVGSAGSGGSGGSAVVPEEPKVSVITLTTTPPGAAIYIDGIDSGKVTPQPIEVPKDMKAVTITLRLDRYQDKVLKNLSVENDVNDTFELKKKSSGGGGTVKGGGGTGKGSGGKGTGSGRKDDSGLERPE